LTQSNGAPKLVIAVDPGRDKCGLAVVTRDGQVLEKAVIQTSAVGEAVAKLLREHPGAAVVLGDRTAAEAVRARLDEQAQARVVLVDEHRSTEQGRRRYFNENPPRGWRRLLPIGLQTPPRPYDDYVALVIAERYWGRVARSD
jgi:RNase H-fold protein (predicted Holliday junction resolvase)